MADEPTVDEPTVDRPTVDGADSEGHGEFPAHRARRSFLSRHLLGTILAALLVVILAVLGGGWAWYSSAESSSPGQGVVFDVALGEGFSSVRSSLEREGIVSNGLAFDLYVTIHGTPDVLAGQYYLHKHDSFGDVLGVLNAPPNVLALQVPPGFTVPEVAARLEAAGYGDLGAAFETLATSGKVTSPFQPQGSKNLDGLLAAGTYQVLPTQSAQSLLTQMIDRFSAAAEALGVKPGQQVNGLDAYQVVTVASIVEKEGVIQKNLAKVSRVIYNRLAPRNASSDGLDGPLLARPRRRSCHAGGPQDQVSLQHVLEHWPHSYSDLLPVYELPSSGRRSRTGHVVVLHPRLPRWDRGFLHDLRGTGRQREVGSRTRAPLNR